MKNGGGEFPFYEQKILFMKKKQKYLRINYSKILGKLILI